MDTQTTARSFRVKEFEGPLDLLLFLIKKNEVNIYDIPIAQITEQYIEYLKYAAELDLEDLTEFHAMAAMLLYIKSRMLLPVEVEFDDDIEDPRQDLVEKLIEYQKLRKLSELMEEKA
jgi:segregation and condensation protein A